MNRTIILAPILAGAGLTVFAVSWTFHRSEQVPVVTVPQLIREPVAQVPGGRTKLALTTSSLGDPASLARELQRELKRVGCYDGPVNGRWTAPTRAAMKAFTDSVNAVLPTDKPDGALLSLVQGTQDAVCGAHCPTGQVLNKDGRCLPDAVVADAAGESGPPEPAPDAAAETPNPTITGWSPTAGVAPGPAPPPSESAIALARPSAEVARAPPDDRAAQTDAPQTAPETAARSDGAQGAPAEVSDHRPRRSARAASSRPPKFVRTLMRNVARALAPFGF